ncbi:hypothetical protein Y032_0257g407 [Ancylostoma ceylanicum]|uniref:Phosphoribosyltransferase domain-containing protein n=1 Tax=Ancylostoma ceylanicum TaxID=53326 RepID=A0A016SBL6_9BILA|nr:hypothetical protein Y032_0257g407 [Ancylostoma ceylanicum]
MNGIVDKEKDEEIEHFKENGTLALLGETNQILELQTILKDRNTDHSDFVFYADRLMRLVIEEALNKLPYTEITITTPTHCQYKDTMSVNGTQLSNCKKEPLTPRHLLQHSMELMF